MSRSFAKTTGQTVSFARVEAIRPPVFEGRALLIEGLCPTLQPGAGESGSWMIFGDFGLKWWYIPNKTMGLFSY